MSWTALAIAYGVIAFATMAGVTYYMARTDGKPKSYMYGGDMAGPIGVMFGLFWPLFLVMSPIFITVEIAQRLGYKAHDRAKPL